jgi:hypothetical protein
MRPSFLITLLLCIGSFSTAAILFLDDASQASSKRTAPQSSIEIKWGEGSEAGTPD